MASVAVFLGLIFVALELRENSRVATEQGISAMSGAYSNFLSRLDDPSARDVLIRAMEDSGEFSLDESLQLMSLYLELVNGAEADFVIGESRGLSSDISVSNALSTTIWLSNRQRCYTRPLDQVTQAFFFFLGFGSGNSAAVTVSKFVNHSPSSI